MDENQSFEENLRKAYGFESWPTSAIAAVSERRRGFVAEESPPGFAFESRNPFPGQRSYIDVFRSTTDPDALLNVRIAEFDSDQEARVAMMSDLYQVMAPTLPRLETLGVAAGEIGFGGHGELQTSVRFVRGPIYVVVQNAGAKHVPVKEMAEWLDGHLTRHLTSG